MVLSGEPLYQLLVLGVLSRHPVRPKAQLAKSQNVGRPGSDTVLVCAQLGRRLVLALILVVLGVNLHVLERDHLSAFLALDRAVATVGLVRVQASDPIAGVGGKGALLSQCVAVAANYEPFRTIGATVEGEIWKLS